MMSLLAVSEIYQRAVIQLDGTVISSQTTCVQPENNRCATVYIVEGLNGSKTTYIAGPTDHSLLRRLPVGTEIVKGKWSLNYSIDQKINKGFPTKLYFALLGIGLCCAVSLVALKGGT
jgi:hypothetical protein